MIFNSQGDATLRQYINGQTITPGEEVITLPGKAVLLGDVSIDGRAAYNEGYAKGYAAGYEEGQAAALPYAAKLAYIESTGTQQINTGVIPGSSDFTIRMKVQPMLEISDANWAVGNWFVTMYDVISSVKGATLQIGTIKSKFAVHLGMVTDDGTETPTGEAVELVFSVSGNTATLTGGSTDTRTSDYFATGAYRNYPILICDGLWRAENVQIEVGGKLVRDLIPVLDYGGEACMFDKVNKRFYYNQGSGEFEYELLAA